MTHSNHHDAEEYLLLLLSDANLPTGSFVASSGLESFIKHGFASPTTTSLGNPPFLCPESSAPLPPVSPPPLAKATINFVRDSLNTYAHSTLPFIWEVHESLEKLGSGSGRTRERQSDEGKEESKLEAAMGIVTKLDALYESMTLNHVARRASKSQGVALLTLYTKGFTRPSWIPAPIQKKPTFSDESESGGKLGWDDAEVEGLVDELKLRVRKGSTAGHLPICWGVLTFCLGLAKDRSQYLHLFLHARALLSASIRLNTIGPYAAQQVLLHVVKPAVEETVAEAKSLRVGWEEGDLLPDDDEGPSTTWPLGEILACRHDLQHSRIFNS